LNVKRADFKEKDLESFQAAASHHQKKLRESAVSMGHEIYHEQPADFVERVDRQWYAWQKGLSASSIRRRTRSSTAR
ncbi:MAG: hypothetical protein WBW33_17520, partial [Bryobacteraceae bacterium]